MSVNNFSAEEISNVAQSVRFHLGDQLLTFGENAYSEKMAKEGFCDGDIAKVQEGMISEFWRKVSIANQAQYAHRYGENNDGPMEIIEKKIDVYRDAKLSLCGTRMELQLILSNSDLFLSESNAKTLNRFVAILGDRIIRNYETERQKTKGGA